MRRPIRSASRSSDQLSSGSSSSLPLQQHLGIFLLLLYVMRIRIHSLEALRPVFFTRNHTIDASNSGISKKRQTITMQTIMLKTFLIRIHIFILRVGSIFFRIQSCVFLLLTRISTIFKNHFFLIKHLILVKALIFNF